MLIAALGTLLTVLVVAGFERGLAQDAAHARSFALAILVCASAGLTTALSRLRTWAARLVVAATLLATFALIEIPALAASLHLVAALRAGLRPRARGRVRRRRADPGSLGARPLAGWPARRAEASPEPGEAA